MEAVALAHRHTCERLEIAGQDRLLHLRHALGHHRLRPRSEKGGRGDRLLHPRRARDVFLRIADHHDQRTHFRPVAPRRHFPRTAVSPVVEHTSVPGDIAAEQTAAGGAGALARDQGELGWSVWELI